MPLEPISGKRLLFPPGRVEVRLNADHRRAYRKLYAQYRSIFDGLPALRDRDFDGRPLRLTTAQLEALNAAFASLERSESRGDDVFGAQELEKTDLFKRLQFLS